MSSHDRVLPEGIGPRAAPEFSRPFATARIGEGARTLVEARPEECRALAVRLGLDAVHALACDFNLRRSGGDAIAAAGLLRARVRQVCVVSLDPFDAEIIEDFSVRFVPEGSESDDLELEADDELTYEGGVLDLGEAASEQLALALDPFPRKPGAELPGAAEAGSGGAFADLAKLLPRN